MLANVEKKKIAAVITLHSVCNYGTQLQAYATQEILKHYFDDVVFVDFRRADTQGIGLLKTFTKGNILKAPAVVPTLLYWKYVYGKFQKKYLNLTEKVYKREEDFQCDDDFADVYFAGSDQVWNCGWNRGVIAPYYLSFVPDNKPKFAFASSFGQREVEEKYVKESLKYIKRFDYITVREESGARILKEQYQYDRVDRILDPTLMLPADFWRGKAPASRIKDKYILVYNLQRSKDFDKFAEQLGRRTGYKLYRFCTRFDQIVKNGKSIVIPDIMRFVTLIDHAELVLTDSFHATAFAMNMNTEPICVYPDEYAGRISEFLHLVGEEKRHISNFNDWDVLNRKVDFVKVNRILESEREREKEILQEKFHLYP